MWLSGSIPCSQITPYGTKLQRDHRLNNDRGSSRLVQEFHLRLTNRFSGILLVPVLQQYGNMNVLDETDTEIQGSAT